MEQKEHIIDATDKRLGRVASEAAQYLMGKVNADFAPNKAGSIPVRVQNAAKLYLSEKKQVQKTYVHYTGYPGGKREETLEHLRARKGTQEIIRKAVYGMLPANKLRSIRMKSLTIEE